MGLFDFFKGKSNESEKAQEKYWSLTTTLGEIEVPTIEEIETAVKQATPEQTMFATLAFNNSGLEIESVQAISDDGYYRFEALTADGIIYVKNNLTCEETLELFTHYFKYQRVSGYRSWSTERY